MEEAGMASDDQSRPMRGGEVVPVPDPTLLTTIAVDRAIADFKQLVDARIKELDKAVLLAADNLQKQRTYHDDELNHRLNQVTIDRLAQRDLIQSQIETLAAVTGEKFNGIDTRLAEAKVALDAALAAQKDAVAAQNEANSKAIQKSEDATIKQIDEVKNGMTTAIEGLNDKISDLKSRIDRGDGASTSYAAMYIGLVAAGGLMLALGSFIYSVTR
jgi:vacuolar-type H+-ATPase subunit I/STV1